MRTWLGKPDDETKERAGEGGGDARPDPKPLHNLDLSTLKVLPKEREAGWGVKQPSGQSVQSEPAEQQAAGGETGLSKALQQR